MKPEIVYREGINEAIDYATSHGMLISNDRSAPNGTSISHAPFTYMPTPFDYRCYMKALKITEPLNRLVYNLSRDTNYLRSKLCETANSDPQFVKRLLNILQSATKSPIELYINRFDYFCDSTEKRTGVIGAPPVLKMVEMNLMSAGGSSIASTTSDMHRYLSQHPVCEWSAEVENMPYNDAIGGLCEGIYTAHDMFKQRYKTTDPCLPIIIMKTSERNQYDRIPLTQTMWTRYGTHIVPLTFEEVHNNGSVDRNGLLHIYIHTMKRKIIVSVAYFRVGFAPEDYTSEEDWNARTLIEKSICVKCPTISMQLASMKKIQQVIFESGEAERFLRNTVEVEEIRGTFMKQYALSADEKGDLVAHMAISRPEDFVMKPQREGGGHMLSRSKMKKALLEMSRAERVAYVLMDRILPTEEENVIVRNGRTTRGSVVAELGVFGVIVARDGDIVANFASGTLLRSKMAFHDDGGIAAGVSAYDSPLLMECNDVDRKVSLSSKDYFRNGNEFEDIARDIEEESMRSMINIQQDIH